MAGSPAFRLEVLLLGDKTRLSRLQEGKSKLFAIASGIGLAIVMATIGLSIVLSLDSLYLCAILLGVTLVIGKISSLGGSGRKGAKPEPQVNSSEGDVKKILKKRDLENLMGGDEEKKPENAGQK